MDKSQPSPQSQTPHCSVRHPVDLSEVRSRRSQLLDVDKAQRMAAFFSCLGDPNRLRILSVLSQGDQCVCDLAAVVNMSESAVSHQLRTLRAHRIVGYRRQGRNVFYYLQDDHVANLYHEIAEHLDEPEDS
ncbi:metalloregulator ArsR/SmtB family transcription factor [Phormidium yuhuli AB48]|uniref:Metalloregulator ArsR/SmtB family transcription factor n=1 Tax=Phormidium yuhuli AB48 TaxID=2940671 RepID=A0ABY5AR24_9CYAN|nr:metalloregulator ArsR/SmtB family transcription factor [Phormidium yuhuli]USR90603.1 metalloregulator ArsR/SmtB family transcription factor [Phormidium yuhuli AB48]